MNSYHYLLKFIMIGDTNVGKSCLLLQYTDKRFRTELDPTIGVEFGSKNVTLNGKSLKLQIWDTGGQEAFRSITRSYYRGSIGAILVYDVTRKDSLENIQKWIKEIKTYATDKMVMILVGNKNDLSHMRQVTYDEGENLASKLGIDFLETSAKTAINVDSVFNKVADKILAKIETMDIDPYNENYGIKLGREITQRQPSTFEVQMNENKKTKCC